MIASLTLVNITFVSLLVAAYILSPLKSGFEYCAVIDIPNPPGCDPFAIDAQNKILAALTVSGIIFLGITYYLALKEKTWALYLNLSGIILSAFWYFYEIIS